ncbi:hypothetical protein MKL18_02165 [Enterococcus faecalis]|nr:hypothetical protein [Enterococcus faecalis]MCH1670740.1 hypothetical protein [Enterococcus faecalis]
MKKKVIFTSFLLLTVALSGCSQSTEKTNNSSETEVGKLDNKKEELISSTLKDLQDNFSKNHKVTFDKESKSFVLDPIVGLSVTDTLKTVADNAEIPKYKDSLTDISSNFTNLSKSISKAIGKEYKIKLKYPGDINKDVFVVQDGNVTFPILDSNSSHSSKELEYQNYLVRDSDYIFESTGAISKFNTDSKQLDIDISNVKQLDSSDIKKSLLDSAKSLSKSAKSAYEIDYPIVLLKDNKEIAKIVNGEVVSENF